MAYRGFKVAGASKSSNDPCTPHSIGCKVVFNKNGSESEFRGSLNSMILTRFCAISAVGNVVVLKSENRPSVKTIITCKYNGLIIST